MTEEIIINEKSLQAVLKRYDELEQENKQMKSALEEIREIIYYCGYKDVVDKVLPKINELLNLS